MAMEEDLLSRLKAVAGIYAITGDAVQWFEFGRGDSGGQVMLSIVTPGREWTLSAPDWLDRPRVRFDIRSSSSAEVWTLKRLILAEMETESETGSTRFHPAQLEAERPVPLGEQEGGAPLYQYQIEFMFYHEEL